MPSRCTRGVAPLPASVRALWVLAALAPARAAGQETGLVFGTVKDSAGAPIPGVAVSAAPAAGPAAVTDAAGRYRLAVPAGARIVRFARLGFAERRDPVRVSPGDSVRLDVVLAAAHVRVEPVIVTAAKRSQLLDQAVTSVALVTDTDLARRAVSTVDEAVNRAAAVQFLSGQINIRGSSGFVEGLGSRVLLLVDGVPANQGDRGGIDWDLVPLAAVERVEIVKGAGSSLYGSAALGGVVNVITRDIPPGLHGGMRASAGAYANPPEAVWAFRTRRGGLWGADATGSYGAGPVRASLTLGGRHSDGYREQDRSDQWETAGKAEWRPRADTRLTAAGAWTSHQYEVAPPWCERGHCDDRGLAFQPFRIDTANRGAYTRSDKGYLAATFERTHSPRLAWHARGSWLRTHFTDVKPNGWGVGDRVGGEVRAVARGAAAGGRVVTAGAEAARAAATSDIFGRHAQYELAAYGEVEQPAGPARLSAGARLDCIAVTGTSCVAVPSPRLGAVLATPLGTWRASAARGFRAPSLAERFVRTQAFGFQVVPNPGLGPETAWSFELGDAAELGAGGRVDAALFWTEARALIEPAFFVEGGVPKIQLRNVSRARLRGLDVAVVAPTFLHGLTAGVAYQYLDARDLRSDSVLAFRPAHLATASADYAWRAWSVGGDFRFASRIARIELGGIYAADPRVATKTLDLRAGWTRGPLAVRLLVTNALNYIYSLVPGTLEPVRTAAVVLDWRY
jgi:iron complex outermembrane receptor protein